MSLFIPLSKADASRRLVYGHIDETPDRSGEVFDYPSSKPHFAAWSDEARKATGGKSLGNIRAMHGAVAAGKVVDLAFDDARKSIEVCAHIVDDDEWKKVEQGVYTGFSPGGRYLKRWADGGYTRYTAAPSEISIVDLPCIPSAGFTMVKADGMEERVAFLSKAGRRNSHEDQTRIQTMHDTAVSLGACCRPQADEQPDADDMGKAADFAEATVALTKAADALAKMRQERDMAKAETVRLSDENGTLKKRIAELEAMPAPGGPVLTIASKEAEMGGADSTDGVLLAKIRAMPDGHDKRQALMKLVHQGVL